MPETVPRDPDADKTLVDVLDRIKLRNQNRRVLTDYSVKTDEVSLTFQALP
jgi:hypothetical protein